VIWVRENAKAMRRADDHLIILVACEDITERKRTEDALRQSELSLAHANRVATIGELTTSIAHEVNQPIAALVINAQTALRLLRTEPPDLVQGCEALDDIIKDGRRASDVIERIRALVKKKPPQTDLLNINEVIIETITLTRGEILRNDVSLETQLAKDLPPIRGDRVQLQQVFMNLVMNAVETMNTVDEGTRELKIGSGKDQEDRILVSVCDSGPALKSETLDRFFEAFYSTKSHGMGMGLSICRSIIESHSGRIWATPNVSRGVTFHIALPDAKAPS
jgi:C4-dicarboxylate-specific signal transduction histidine kinase